MARKRSRGKPAFSLVLGPSVRQVTWMFVFLAVLFAGILFTMFAASQKTAPPPRAQGSCNDSGCQNVLWQKSPAIYQITNCDPSATSCDANGDQQICTGKRFGACGGQTYCCPGSGQKWTTNLSACAGAPAYQSPCTPSPTPTGTPTPTPTPAPTPTGTPTPTPTPYVYVEPATPTPTRTPTPTPTSYILASCNKSCTSNADCPGGLTCTTAFGQNVCRNPVCSDQFSCLCGQGSFAQLVLTPTPTEGNIGAGPQVSITVSTFTDANGVASNTPTLTGLTEPGALVTVSIFPDGVSGTVTADAAGRWSWRSTKTLSPGQKNLLIVAKNANGGQGQVSAAFTVPQGKSAGPGGLIIIVLVISGLAFGGYVYYKSNNP